VPAYPMACAVGCILSPIRGCARRAENSFAGPVESAGKVGILRLRSAIRDESHSFAQDDK